MMAEQMAQISRQQIKIHQNINGIYKKDPHKPMWETFYLKKDPYELNKVYSDLNYSEIREL